MKKIIPFLVFLLILSSCSNWKYGGKVRPSGNEVHYADVVIEKNKVEPLVFNVPTIESKDVAIAEYPTQKENLKAEKSLEQLTDLGQAKDISWIPVQDKVVENEDSLKRQEEILVLAKKAEREGKKSRVFGILGAVFAFTPIAITGLIFSVVALKQSRRALKSQYITPEGLKAAKIGLILSIVGLAISILVILTITSLFLFAIFF